MDLKADRLATPDEIRCFHDNGHVAVRGLASADEVAEFAPTILGAADLFAWNRDVPLEKQRTYDRAFHQAIGLCWHDDVIRRFVFAARFARVAAELLGVDGVRLYHDQALVKRAGGGPTPWHQDAYYWPVDGGSAITMWMAMADIPADAGSMVFADGTHHRGDLRGPAISDESEDRFAALVVDEALPTSTHGAMAAGDATFHAGWTLHSAGPNPTGADRPAMTVIYVADGTTIIEPERDEQRLDLALYLPDAAPGDAAATHRNPLLWGSGNPEPAP
ncbi:MAG: phytanoyl-CoA dioxygenase family protein [Actinobacteria bacterium]|nr:phytanoyl-CoA dioxygenase family protein [Actinomycetota bacterium]